MGCFFTCFRFRDDDRQLGARLDSTPVSAKTTDKFVSRNQLASLFLCEEDESLCGSSKSLDSTDRELKREVKLLKACGVISETPIEMRKESMKINLHGEADREASSKTHPKLLDGSIKKLVWDEENMDTTVSRVMDGSNASACSSRRSASGQQLECKSTTSLSFLLSDHQNINSPCFWSVDSVLMEDSKDCHATDSNVVSDALNICSSQVDINKHIDLKTVTISKLSLSNVSTPEVVPGDKVSKHNKSPSPTPLQLSDDMKTPGTVYPKNLGNFLVGNAQLRTQYIYPVTKPVNDISQLKSANCKDEPVNLYDLSDQDRDTLLLRPEWSTSLPKIHKRSHQLLLGENPQHPSAASVLENFEMPFNVNRKLETFPAITPVESLSQWLKPPVPENERRKRWECSMKEVSESDRERPIIGTVAHHWSEDDAFHTSPKWWDGKGIPNSTNKYKEDQKVSWHATPFEERLEKALSEESIYPERILKGKPINFEEECDIATC